MNIYSFREFQKDFPSDKVCLEYIFKKKYPNIQGYYPVKGRKCFANAQGEQIHPLAGTIFEKSSTPLTTWFYAIFLFSASRNGVAARELQRQLGVTLKTAWRIGKQIRSLMAQGGDMLSGNVEVDETYIGGKYRAKEKFKNKAPIMGMVERKGRIKANHIPNRETHIILNQIQQNVKRGSNIISDEFGAYKKVLRLGYTRSAVKHFRKEYVRGAVHTNSVEGAWGLFKTYLTGTHHSVSKKHLQSYVDEFTFKYNARLSPVPVFHLVMDRMVG